MHPYRVVILDRAALPDAVTIGDFKFPHTLDVYQSTDDRSAAERIADADIVITNKVMLRHEAIAAAKRLKLVAVAATGTDNIDVESCRERDIEVRNVRGYANHAVPEHVFALLLALRRSIVSYRQSVIRR